MVTMKARLKFKDSLPLKLQTTLVMNGYRLSERKDGEFIVYEKLRPVAKIVPIGVSSARQIFLSKCCRGIRDKFHDHHANSALIRFRINEMCKAFTLQERIWCEDWMSRNLDAL